MLSTNRFVNVVESLGKNDQPPSDELSEIVFARPRLLGQLDANLPMLLLTVEAKHALVAIARYDELSCSL